VTAVDSRLADALAGRYEVKNVLGRGGMATVYLAQDLRHKRAVALKVLDPALGAILGPGRFLREIETAAGLQHPNILPVHDSGEADGLLWYTMPYVEGESLRDRLRREGPLPVSEAVRLGQEIADALEAAHKRRVVHRDIKPENVLLSHGRALVADFGIARSTQPSEATALTQTGVSLGTPAYMSPEQIVGERDLDGRSDIYALGCLVYELLAGRPPYVASTAQAIISQHLAAAVPDVRQVRPEVPAGIAAAVTRAMAKEPDSRFATAAEFSRALAIPSAPFPSTAPVKPATARRKSNRLSPLLIGTGAIAVIAALAAGLWFGRHRSAAAGPLRLAVLPFRNLGDSSGVYLTDGLVDGVRGRLAAMPAFQVIASTSTEAYRDMRKPVQQIGRELNVPYIVVGKVRWSKDQAGTPSLQITPELIEAQSGVTRWQDPVQARPSDVLQIQADIATHVAEALGVSTPHPPTAGSDSLTQNPEAYDAFLRAQELVRQIEHYASAGRQFEPAIALYRKALALDPSFALAKVRLAYALTLSGRALRDTTHYAEADTLLGDVLREHPKFASALVVKADLREYQGDLADASRLIHEAAALQPNDAAILGELTWRQAIELDSSAVETGAKAVALAPRDAEMLRTVIAATFLFRHFETLQGYCEQLIALDPTDYMGYLNQAMALVLSRGDTAKAVAALAQGEAMAGHVPRPLAWGYAEMGPSGWKRWERLSLPDLGPAFAGDTVDFYFWHALVANAQGRHSTARAYADSVIRVVGKVTLLGWRNALARGERAYARALRGDVAGGERDLRESEILFQKEEPSAREQYQEELTAVVAELGDSTRALAMARRLLERPSGFTRYGLRFSPAFARLWGWPEFQRLMADTTLPPRQ
jgi:eukaryotic-like serine/threonine-protein kinase